MKLAELFPWASAGVGSVLTGWGLWFTSAKLRDERKRDEAARDDKRRVDAEAANNQSAGFWRSYAEDMRVERAELLKRVDQLQGTVDALRTEVQDLRAAAFRARERSEQLEGELRQANQVIASHRRVSRLPNDPPSAEEDQGQ